MKSKIILLLAVALSFASISLFTGCDEVEYTFYSSITGTVYDFSTGEVLEKVSVVLSPSNKTEFTNTDGAFSFVDLDPAQYTLTFQKEGYYTERKSVTAITGEKTHLEITLKKI